MKTKEEIEERIATIEDDLACAEHDEEMDGESSVDMDSLRCELSDLRMELKERFNVDRRFHKGKSSESSQ